MVKATKKNLSEFAQQRHNQKNKKLLNPFEVHINRDKQKVLGRKNKNDRGLPGVSRAKAINRRKQSLLQEYKLKNKDNMFLDKRIGEMNSAMSTEDKAMARFTKERIKAHKKNIFNLNDDEILTHRGQTLEEIEKFDDPKSDEEFSDNGSVSGRLDKNFVEEAHFGGGVLSKSEGTLSRKDLINQLIAESKKRKAEKQKIREQTIDLTEKLDSEWRDLLPVVSASKKTDKDTEETTKADAYDIAVQQLKFEARGNPCDKLKSEEHIICEEKERLEALEADRLARMKGFVSDANNQYKHKSADDLDDDFIIETIAKDADDNNSITSDVNNEHDGITDNKESDDDDDNDENSNGDYNDDDNDINDAEEKKLEINKLESNYQEEKEAIGTMKAIKINQNESEVEGLNDGESEDDEDNFSDLKDSELSSEDEDMIVEKHVTFVDNLITNTEKANQLDQISNKSILKKNDNIGYEQKVSDKINKQNIREDLLKRKDIMEKARKELPYTYSAPESFEELEKLLEDHNAHDQSHIIDRIIKCNHWTINGKNKEKMSNLFVYLIQHINNCASTNNADSLVRCFQIFDRLCPHFYDLAQMNPENAKTCIQEVIKEKHEIFEKNKKIYPDMDTLIFFKLVSLLFPTSDFRHPVVSPCLIFMSQILLRARIRKYRSDISKGLFICTLILEYTLLSKRFAPSVINFLRGIIYAATPAELTQKIKIIPPFKVSCKVLVINKTDVAITDIKGAHMSASDLVNEALDDEFRIRALLTAVNLLSEFKDQLQELEAIHSIFKPVLELLKKNKFKKYSSNIRNHIKELRKSLELLQSNKLEYIVLEKKRPKPLRTYEPKIMTIYDGKNHKSMSKEKAEREKLLHKYKREFKGAIREIRRDRDFLAKVQISQQIKSDVERKRRVKEIFGDAAVQQSELKKMKRKK